MVPASLTYDSWRCGLSQGFVDSLVLGFKVGGLGFGGLGVWGLDLRV
jgi:hypothetical protein